MLEDDTDLTDQWQATRVRPIIEGTVGGIYDFRFTPDFGQGRTVIQDAYVTARFKPRVPAHRRQVQVAGRPRAPAVGERHPLRVARLPDQPRAEPRPRPAGRRQPARRPVSLRRRLRSTAATTARAARAFGDVDLNDDKEWAGAAVRAALRGVRQLRAARARHRHRRHLHRPGRHGGPAAAADLPHAGAGDVLPLPDRHDADARGRRAHAPRAAALLLRRQLRPARRVHGGVAGRRADHDGRRCATGTVDTTAWQLAATGS